MKMLHYSLTSLAELADECFPSCGDMVYGVAYEIRKAWMGERGINLTPTHEIFSSELITEMDLPEDQILLYTQLVWTDVLFLFLVLDDLAQVYDRLQQKLNKRQEPAHWNVVYSEIRYFQAQVILCLQEILTSGGFKRLKRAILNRNLDLKHYYVQYPDILARRFLSMTPAKRLKSLPGMMEALAIPGEDYHQKVAEIQVEAHRLGAKPEDIEIDLDREVEW